MTSEDHQSAAAALESLLPRVARRLEAVEREDAGRLARVDVVLEGFAPLDWLRAQRHCTQYYWEDRAGAFAMAGVGEADVLDARGPQAPPDSEGVFARMRQRLAHDTPDLRYYGGFRFRPDAARGGRWQAFKAYRFVVPRFELFQKEDTVRLACNFLLGGAEENAATLHTVQSEAECLRFSAPPPLELPRVLERSDLPDRAAWGRLIEQALEAFADNTLQKVVLARETALRLSAAPDPATLLARLLQVARPAYAFCFHPVEDRAFLGASPECLYKRDKRHLESEALAGTRPRGESPEADAVLGEVLLGSNKDLREHRFVLRMLRGHLQRFCGALKEDEAPSLMRLRHCQHLHTRIEGELKQDGMDAALIDALHPTPAVGGTPRDSALDWIAAHEPFDRGIYAAPVGWVGHDAAEFCVAIRSGLIQGSELSLYTGAGIVPGSRPEEEWQEIETKMAAFLDALTHEPE